MPINGPSENAASTRASAAPGDSTAPLSVSDSRAKDIGATSERRRLSNIFQRLMVRIG